MRRGVIVAVRSRRGVGGSSSRVRNKANSQPHRRQLANRPGL